MQEDGSPRNSKELPSSHFDVFGESFQAAFVANVASKLKKDRADWSALRLVSRSWSRAVNRDIQRVVVARCVDIRKGAVHQPSLAVMAARFPSLTHIDLKRQGQNAIDEQLSQVAGLRSLSAECAVYPATLGGLSRLVQLKALRLSLAPEATRMTVRARPRSEWLQMDSQHYWPDLAVISTLTNLVDLEICATWQTASWCDEVLPAGLTSLSLHLEGNSTACLRRLSGLRQLTLQFQFGVRTAFFDLEPIQGLAHLSCLAISNESHTRRRWILLGLHKMTQLRSFSMDARNIILTNDMARLTNLEELCLACCSRPGIDWLRGLTQLKKLKLVRVVENGQYIESLPFVELAKLKELTLSRCIMTRAPWDPCNNFRALTQLVSLDLSYCSQLRTEMMGHISTLTGLTALSLAGNDWVRQHTRRLQDSFITITVLSALQKLDISECRNLCQDSLLYLQDLSALKALGLARNSWLGQRGFEDLMEMIGLRMLDIRGCEFVQKRSLQELCSKMRLTYLCLDPYEWMCPKDAVWLKGPLGCCRAVEIDVLKIFCLDN